MRLANMLFTVFIILVSRIKVIPALASACGENQPQVINVRSGENGILGIPLSGNHIFPSTRCSWTLVNQDNEKIHLAFEHFDIADNPLCNKNGLMIFNGSFNEVNLMGKYCSLYKPPEEITIEAKSLLLYAYGMDPETIGTFQIRYSTISRPKPCGKKEITCRNGQCVSKKNICNRRDDCGDGTDEEHCGFKLKLTPKCGTPKMSPSFANFRIVGGYEARAGSWPWQVSLRLKSNVHQCGASLINTQWIITAAHCFRSASDITEWIVLLGKHKKWEKDSTEQLRYIEKLYIHPDYSFENPQVKANDIALIKLNAAVELTDFISPICLPRRHDKINQNKELHVTGWGLTLETAEENVLNQVMVGMVKHKICKNILQDQYVITSTMLCAGNGARDACVGDSGGPLVTKIRKKWYLVGVVSFGDNCGVFGKPGVYTEVRHYHKWVMKMMKRERNNSLYV